MDRGVAFPEVSHGPVYSAVRRSGRPQGFDRGGPREWGCFDTPRQLGAFVGLIPSEYSSGSSRRQGGITKAGHGRARRALIEAAWAYRHPAKVSAHIQTRIDHVQKTWQDLGWKAQVNFDDALRETVRWYLQPMKPE